VVPGVSRDLMVLASVRQLYLPGDGHESGRLPAGVIKSGRKFGSRDGLPCRATWTRIRREPRRISGRCRGVSWIAHRPTCQVPGIRPRALRPGRARRSGDSACPA